MRKFCIYGKGGIGKSTAVANTAAAMAEMGLKVAVVGCDPKADSTRCIAGRKIPTVLDRLQRPSAESAAVTGYRNILCIESGGPQPGTGCAGRGIAAALREIREKICWKAATLFFTTCSATLSAAGSACRCGKKSPKKFTS